MKYLIIALVCLVSFGVQAQEEEWGSLKGNTLTVKEIPPVWPGCEEKEPSQRDRCFKQKLIRHIMSNYKYPSDAYKNNEQGEVTVIFDITEEGTVKIKEVSGGTNSLQEEAKRNILLIPKMKPGMMAGKPKAVEYTVPIGFKTGKSKS